MYLKFFLRNNIKPFFFLFFFIFTYSPSLPTIRIHGGGINTYDDSSKKSTITESTHSTRPYDEDSNLEYDDFQCTQEAADECDRTIKNFERVINTTPSQRTVSKSHMLVVKLTNKVREMTKMVQVLQKNYRTTKKRNSTNRFWRGTKRSTRCACRLT